MGFPSSFRPGRLARVYTMLESEALSSGHCSPHCITVSSTKADRKLLVVSDHRIQMPNVPSHQKALTGLAQFGDRKAETANSGEIDMSGRAGDFQPQTLPPAWRLRWPRWGGHGPCSSGPVSSGNLNFLQASLGHICEHIHGIIHHSLPSPGVQ